MRRRAAMVAAEFDSAADLRDAAEAMHGSGVRQIDACSPYEVPGLATLLHPRKSPIPRIGLIGGFVGVVVGYFVQWYTNAWAFPINAGGRPAHAIPSFIFITFETMVLFSAISLFIGVFATLGLPRYYNPLWEIDGFERVSTDRFWLVVTRSDKAGESSIIDSVLAASRARRVVALDGTS